MRGLRPRWIGLWWPRVRARLPRGGPVGIDAAVPVAADVASPAVMVLTRYAVEQPHAFPELPADTDDEALARGARRHGVTAFCLQTLEKAPARVPDGAIARLRSICRSQATVTEADLAGIADVLRVLGNTGLSPLLVKGAALGLQVYPAPSLRPFADLDLLLPRTDAFKAMRVLEKEGWVNATGAPPRACRHLLRAGADVVLRHPAFHFCVELGTGGAHEAESAGLLRREQMGIKRFRIQDVEASSPDPVEHFLFCILHGTRHGWTRLIWLVDLVQLQQTFDDADWQRLLVLARQRGQRRMLALGCALANSLLGARFPEDATVPCASDPDVRRAIDKCKTWILSGQVNAPDWRWRLALRDRPRDRLGAALRWLFTPTYADIRAFTLPDFAFPLYRLLRPLRLFCRLCLRRSNLPPVAWEKDG